MLCGRIADEIDFASAANISWSMHTMASIKVDGSTAVLSLGGVELHATIVEPRGAGVAFGSEAVDLQPPQTPSPGLNKLVVVLQGSGDADGGSEAGSGASSSVRIVVGLSVSAAAAAPAVQPLAQWQASGPFTSTGSA